MRFKLFRTGIIFLDRQALDKLSSRLVTSSPTNSTRASRSPQPPHSSSSSSAASSSRLSSHSHSHSLPHPRHNDTLSGSETERESLRAPTPSRSDSHSNSNSYRSSSPEISIAPPVPDAGQRNRRTSAPPSPDKTRQASPGPSRTPRKRVSIASAISAPGAESGRYSVNDNDVTEAALAAVASSRRSPTNRRARQPLPKEFRGGERRSVDEQGSIDPRTPHRSSFRDSGYEEDNSPRTAAHTAANATTSVQYSPRDALAVPMTSPIMHLITGGAGGRLAGESLRAAGIGMRGSVRQAAPLNDDVFGHGRDTNASDERQRRLDADERSRRSGSSARVSEGVGPPASRPHLNSDPPQAPSVLVVERDCKGWRTDHPL
ncbi:hypothetical protein BU15DRAFT_74133 [Melanogaster broomeanus]|nr:hypothetical protein BU15DRAFT_74133 [Melanogaster broomeanus]